MPVYNLYHINGCTLVLSPCLFGYSKRVLGCMTTTSFLPFTQLEVAPGTVLCLNFVPFTWQQSYMLACRRSRIPRGCNNIEKVEKSDKALTINRKNVARFRGTGRSTSR